MVITNRQVKSIRNTFKKGKTTQQQLADKYGVTQGYISLIVLRQRRKNVV